MNDIDQRMAEADQELQQMGEAALNRCLQIGAKADDLQYLAWLAGLTNWKPNADAGTSGLGR